MEHSVKIVKTLAGIGNFVDAVIQDNKINWSDTVHLPKLAVVVPTIIDVVTHFDELKSEIVALDDESHAALVEVFKTEFDLAEEDVEKIVEEAIGILSQIGMAIKKSVEFSKKIS